MFSQDQICEGLYAKELYAMEYSWLLFFKASIGGGPSCKFDNYAKLFGFLLHKCFNSIE